MVRQRIIRTIWKPICAACALPVLTFCQQDPWVGADMGLDGSVPAEETHSSNQDAGVTHGTSSQASNTTSHPTNDQSDTTRATSVADDDVTGDTSVTTQSTTTHATTSGNESTTPNTLDSTAPHTTAASTESAATTTASSTQTNTSDAGDDTSEEPVVDVPEGVPGIIGVGYGGIRIVSRDNGLTWSDQSHWKGPYSEGEDKDDTYLLRSVAYGNGVWVAAGWQLVTSTDGVNWSEPQSTRDVLGQNDCGIADGMAFGKGQFLAACGSSINRSTDGSAWEKASDLPNVGGHPYVVFDATSEQFALTGDNGASFTSDDGNTWTSLDEDKVALCAQGFTSRQECPGFYHDGVLLDSGWPGKILRSTDGSDWDEVYEDPLDIGVYTAYSFAAGYVSP